MKFVRIRREKRKNSKKEKRTINVTKKSDHDVATTMKKTTMKATHKQRSTRDVPNKTGRVTVEISPYALAIWNRRKKMHDNMSLWFENQLIYHYGNTLSPEAQIKILHEELLIAQANRDKVIADYEKVVCDKARAYAALKESMEVRGLISVEYER